MYTRLKKEVKAKERGCILVRTGSFFPLFSFLTVDFAMQIYTTRFLVSVWCRMICAACGRSTTYSSSRDPVFIRIKLYSGEQQRNAYRCPCSTNRFLFDYRSSRYTYCFLSARTIHACFVDFFRCSWYSPSVMLLLAFRRWVELVLRLLSSVRRLSRRGVSSTAVFLSNKQSK